MAEGARGSRDEGNLDQTALRGRVTACLRRLIGTAGCNAMAAVAAQKKPRSLTAWTEERSQTRMSGGVGGVTGAIPSPRPDWAIQLIHLHGHIHNWLLCIPRRYGFRLQQSYIQVPVSFLDIHRQCSIQHHQQILLQSRIFASKRNASYSTLVGQETFSVDRRF